MTTAASIQRELALQTLEHIRSNASPRLVTAIEATLGLRPPLQGAPLQQATTFYVPGLTARAFHDKAVLPWTAALERAYPVIKEELAELRRVIEFQNYTQPHARIHDGGWKTLYLYLGDMRFEHNVRCCPETMKIIDAIPRRTASVMFSALTPGTTIHPHFGPTNVKLRCHMGITGTEGCTFRVGDEERPWRDGECFVFDDSYKHAAHHRGPTTRVVLIVDVWHPDLTEEELIILHQLKHLLPEDHRRLVDEEHRKAMLKSGVPHVNGWWV